MTQSTPAATATVDRLYSLRVAAPPRNPRRGLRHYHGLFADDALVARSLDIGGLLEGLRIDAERFVARHARRRVFVHAGAVTWRGRCLILPGSSGSGKSTLVAALVDNGASELSDEFAVFDRRGRVHPFPRSKPDLASSYIRRSLGRGDPPGDPGLQPPALVAVLRYRAGGDFRPRPLPRSRALLALLEHTVVARRSPARALEALAAGVRMAAAVQGSRGEAKAAAPALLRLLESAAAETGR